MKHSSSCSIYHLNNLKFPPSDPVREFIVVIDGNLHVTCASFFFSVIRTGTSDRGAAAKSG